MQRQEPACALTIAGSDSGGGAGIQADLKTFSALGVWGCTVVTAVTAQNTREVRGSWTLPADAVRMQLEAVLDDFEIGAIKTGMLGGGEIVGAVIGSLPDGIPLIVDPVMVSTSGYRLLEGNAVLDALITCADLITPNIPEAAVLTGMPEPTSIDTMEEAGVRLIDLGAGAALIKGGHLEGEQAVDVYVDRSGTTLLEAERLPFAVHGSGCCLSAAVTAYVAQGLAMREAVIRAKTFITGAIRSPAVSRSGIRMVQPMFERNAGTGHENPLKL